MNLKLTLLILLIALFIFSLSTGHTTASFSQGVTALYYGDGPLGTVMRQIRLCLLYTSPSPRDVEESRMPSSA